MISFIIHQPVLMYAFKVIACSFIFWAFYKGVIEPGRHLTLCRWYLLLALVAPLIIPLLSIPVYPPNPSIVISLDEYNLTLEPEILGQVPLQAKIDLIVLAIFVYLSISSIFAIKFGFRLLALSKICRSGNKTASGVCLIIHSPKVATPFSFIRTVYLPKTLEREEEELFLLHERLHIQKRHSLDILLHEILSLFFWFNPIIRIIGHELKKIHEYQVDRAAIALTPHKNIYKKLIAKEFLGYSPKITHAFNGSLIKKRIIMITKPLKTSLTLLRLALIVPFTALNLLLFSCTAKDSEQENGILSTKANTEAIRFEVVEQKPSFLGGDENDFNKWVKEHVTYPPSAIENGANVRVMLSFVIDVDGSVQEVSVLRGVDPALDKEAIRVVSSSPKWIPGIHNGQTVKVRYNFPVIFQIDNAPLSPSAPSQVLPQTKKVDDGTFAFEMVEQKPKFQGGDENDFNQWVKENITYPLYAKENNIMGRVMLSFVIDTDGTVRDVIVLRSQDPVLDKEAVRVLSSSPKWTPGYDNGIPVKVRYNFPVVFQLR